MASKPKKSVQLFAAPVPKGPPTIFHAHVTRKNLLADVDENLKIKKVLSGDVAMLAGPRGSDNIPDDYSQAYAQVLSLYPLNLKSAIREGDPICDSYRVHTTETGSIWCLADGCNWGPRPCQAANRYGYRIRIPLLPLLC